MAEDTTYYQSELSKRLSCTGKVASGSSQLHFLHALYHMCKPTITLLVVFTAWPTIVLAGRLTNSVASWSIIFAALVGTALMSASAAVFNQLIDLKIDKLMLRTQGRPLPRASMGTGTALAAGLVMGFVGWVLLYYGTTPVAAVLGLGANFFYVFVYTSYLKKRTVQNIVIGGAAGAVGPLIGWAAVTGSIGWTAFWLFMVIFLWTPPHFWALALKYCEDYREAGIPMLPVVKGPDETKKQMFWYSVSLLPVVLLAHYSAGLMGPSVWCNMIATLYFVWKCHSIRRMSGSQGAMGVFGYSCAYLFIVFGFFGLEAWML